MVIGSSDSRVELREDGMRVILWGMEGGREGDWLLHSETDHADLNAVWWVDGVWHGDRWIEGTIIGT